MSVQREGTEGRGGSTPSLDGPLLEHGTQLGFTARYWPGAGEAAIYGTPTRDRAPSRKKRDPDAPGPSEEDRAANRAKAARRARGRVRRRCAHYGLGIMWTLTFAASENGPCPYVEVHQEGARSEAEGGVLVGTTERSEGGSGGVCPCGRPFGTEGLSHAMRETAAFVKRIREQLYMGAPFPYVLVPEFHADGHVHVHLVIREVWPWAVMGRLWGHGNVLYTDFRKRKKGQERGSPGKRAGGYVSKYISKTFEEDYGSDSSGRHRYEVAQGFDPAKQTVGGFRSRQEALEFIRDTYGVTIQHVVKSEDCDPDGPLWAWVDLSILELRNIDHFR